MMSSWILKGSAVVAAAAIGVGLGIWIPAPANSSPADGPAQAWIDDPIDGSTVELGPMEVVAHAYDPSGLTGITLTVDGSVVADNPLDDAGVLAYATWTWTPGSGGVYVLEAYGTGKTGGAGLVGRAVVTVGNARTAAPTTPTLPGSTTTLAPTTTITPESTTTIPPTTTGPTSPTTPPTTAPPTTAPPTTAPTTTTPTTTAPPPCTPPPPILLSPGDGATFIGPAPAITLDWTGWRGSPPECQASGYYAELAMSPGARPIASQHSGSEVTVWTPARTLWSCNADHYWRVYSKRSDGSLGAVSAVWHTRVNCIG